MQSHRLERLNGLRSATVRRRLEHLYLPYGAQRVAGTDEWVMFNRFYAAPGSPSDGWSIWENGPRFQMPTGFNPTMVPELHTTTWHVAASYRLYFFHDGCPPWHNAKSLRRYVRVLSHFYALAESLSTDRGSN